MTKDESVCSLGPWSFVFGRFFEGNQAMERPNAFDFWGPQTVLGPELKPGDRAPAFTLTKGRNEAVTLDQFAGKPLVISVVPSIDTRTCSKQTRRFNEEAATLGDAVNILTVSADMPFAQSRWCGAEGIDAVIMASDHKDMNFGDAYGTHIKDLRFESRAVFVVDAEGVVRHVEYVPVAGREPDYAAALSVLRDLV
jgi:thiol peroxidase